jgi:hypothetical protein
MRVRTVALYGAFGLTALSATVAAAPITVKSGVPTLIASHTSINTANCSSGALPVAKVAQPPAHGTYAILKHEKTLPGNGICAGKPFKGTAILYTSTRGYRGPDAMAFEFSSGDSGIFYRRGSVELLVQ